MDKVKLDMRKMRARDVQKLNKAAREVDNAGVAEIMALVVVSCPAEWGDKDSAETYLDLPWVEFRELRDYIIDELVSTSKN